jgi:hypothetical protein
MMGSPGQYEGILRAKRAFRDLLYPSDKIRLLGFTTLHDSRRYAIPRCLGHSHPDTKAR